MEDLLEIKHLSYDHIDGLINLYENNKKEFEYFIPHLFTKDEITKIINSTVLDFYYVVVFKDTIIGYGMLRGMDDGYDIPRLGVAIDKTVYGIGVATMLMEHLEATCQLCGYKKISLRVYKANTKAYNFYLKLGYKYQNYDSESVLGFKEL